MTTESGNSNNTQGKQSRFSWLKRSAFPVFLAAALGALGGGPGYRAWEDPRRDPFTSRDAETMEARTISQSEAADHAIKIDLQKLEKRMDRMDVRQLSMMDSLSKKPPRELLERVTRAEEKIKYLERFCVQWIYPKPATK